MRRRLTAGSLLVLTLLLAGACRTQPTARETILHGLTMGSEWTVKIAGRLPRDEEQLQRDVQRRFDAVVAQMSTYEAESDLSRFNRSPPGQWQALPPQLFQVLDYALQLARSTDGVYDPTVGPLVNLWGFGPEPRARTPPDAQAIAATRARTGWRRVELDADGSRARHAEGVYVDLSSLAKGFGVDAAAHYLDSLGVTNYLIDLSGKLRARGSNAMQRPWRVAVEMPGADDASSGAGRLSARVVAPGDRAVASAGDYRRYFDADGHRYSHIIDPRTGAPITHALDSVTVVAEDCLQADALATALLVLGPTAAAEHARRHDIAALFIARDASGERHYVATPAFTRFEQR